MSFAFNLENVRKQRGRVLDTLSRELADRRNRLGDLESRLADLEEDLAANMADTATTSHQVPRVADMIAKTAWLDHLRLRRQALVAERDDAGRLLNETRARLHDAWRELEIINGLRQQQKSHWLVRMVRRERKEMDEIAGVHAHFGSHNSDSSWADPRIPARYSPATGEGRPS